MIGALLLAGPAAQDAGAQFSGVRATRVSESLGIDSRVRWIPRPGSDLFLVWNQTQAHVAGSFVPRIQEAGFKIGFTLRFRGAP